MEHSKYDRRHWLFVVFDGALDKDIDRLILLVEFAAFGDSTAIASQSDNVKFASRHNSHHGFRLWAREPYPVISKHSEE